MLFFRIIDNSSKVPTKDKYDSCWKKSIFGWLIKSVRKWMLLFYNCYKTVSGHFFATCVFIFHKTEVQTVILRCLMGLNCNWFKSYGLRCSRRPHASSVNFWKVASDKWPFYDHIWPLFWKLHYYIIIFDKAEIQTVILRCLTSLNLNWYKSYDTKPKNTKNEKAKNVELVKTSFFLPISTKTDIFVICVFCDFVFFVITFVPIKI